MEHLKLDTPNTSMSQIGASPLNGTPADISLVSIHHSKTNFRYIPSKIAEEAQNNDVQLDIEDDKAVGYFDQDPEEKVQEAIIQEQVEKFTGTKKDWTNPECNGYNMYFKPEVFFKFFLMHLLFFFLLGPFIVILAPLTGIHVLRNQQFIGFNRNAIQQYLEYFGTISFFVVYYITDTVGLESMEIYMICVAILIRLVIISSKYAYQSSCVVQLLSTKTLPLEELFTKQTLLNEWRLQKEGLMEEEIKTTIRRLEIDSPLFLFTFLGKTTPELIEKLSIKNKTQAIDSHKNEKKVEDDEQPPSITSRRTEILSTDRGISIQEPQRAKLEPAKGEMILAAKNHYKMKKAVKSTILIHRTFSHFPKAGKLDKTALSGYNLAFDLLKKARVTRCGHLYKVCFILSVIRALLPTFYRAFEILYEDKDIPLFTGKPYIVAIIFCVNTFLFWANTSLITIVIGDIRTRIFCLKQIGHLISPKKLSYLKDRKLYPTLNIFDPLTLKTWVNLRRLVNDYGRMFILRNSLNVIVSMTFYFFIIAVLVLQMLGIINAYQNRLLIIVFAYESLVFFAIFLAIIYGAAFINDQYKVHKNLLKKNKTIIGDFQRLSYFYVGPHAVEPDNPVYREGLKLLKQELGEDNFESKLIERAEKLTSMIDDIIEELDFEEINESFMVMGVAVNYGLLKSLLIGIVSLIFAIAQSYIN